VLDTGAIEEVINADDGGVFHCWSDGVLTGPLSFHLDGMQILRMDRIDKGTAVA